MMPASNAMILALWNKRSSRCRLNFCFGVLRRLATQSPFSGSVDLANYGNSKRNAQNRQILQLRPSRRAGSI